MYRKKINLLRIILIQIILMVITITVRVIELLKLILQDQM